MDGGFIIEGVCIQNGIWKGSSVELEMKVSWMQYYMAILQFQLINKEKSRSFSLINLNIFLYINIKCISYTDNLYQTI